jgi:outer membrane receptor protein involved in Fe transport
VDYQVVPLRERFSFAITARGFNVPGTAGFNEMLVAHDLTRGGAPFEFDDARVGRQLSAFVQDHVTLGAVTFSAGLRVDRYDLLVHGGAVQPRVGVAWALTSATVLRASYNRNYQTPPTENLLLSSSEAASRLAPASVREALGRSAVAIRPERQHVVEVGVQRGLGAHLGLDVSAYVKRSRDQQDNNNFFDTGIIFPTSLAAIDARGFEGRLTMPSWRGWSASLSATAARAVSTPPFTGGLFLGQDAVDLLSAGPFRIDHDQALGAHATFNYTSPRGWWVGGAVRYDSGLVSNASDPAEVAADPDYRDLLPYVDLAGAPPRVRPRTIVDVTGGVDLRAHDGAGWSIHGQVANLTDAVALYNFQSVFVGTRLVAPRTASVRIRYRW